MLKWGGECRNVIHTVTLIFPVATHAQTHMADYARAHTQTDRVQWPSHFLRQVPFSPFLSPSFSQPLCRCGDKISIPIPPLLPSTAEQEVKTKGTEGKVKRGKEAERKKKLGERS